MKGLYNYWAEIMVFLLLFVFVQYGVYLAFFYPAFLGRYLFILLCAGWVFNAIDIAMQQIEMYGDDSKESIMEQITRYVMAYASSTSDEAVED